ncbi:SDR family oxidoreductase [Methanogenium organophilum]|uniref:SDR family NAD(P)-dependent oxidoreductase n=1 Tax=Methanogenium organophilum TaxID=2199 RepID=A0A9X9S2U1_METOG|nr:SDR family NAD(P)-dependent oxidoreductase [Methanogenium organophilum]WAI00839.1 SDR family NAD(P)-dependent oxidoreductase [Methanogenium organophilum]
MKVAIVTGATGGIGKAVVEELKNKGYFVHEVSRKNCDVTNLDSIKTFMSNITNVDVLVNCAGRSHLGYIEDISEDDICSCFDTNALGTMRFCKAVLPIMKKQKNGYIVNIGSLRGIECCKGKASYSMSKFAVRAFSNTLGLEVKKYGINVTCINPGFVFTDLIKYRIAEENLKPEDIIQPSDIAKTVMYLLSLSDGATISELNMGDVWE